MKKFVLGLVALAMLVGCDKGGSTARLEKMEDRLAALEKALKPARPAGPPPQTAAYTIPMGTSPYLGAKNAPVNVVVFSDAECPFCGRIQGLLKSIPEDSDLKGKVNVVYKHFPLSFHKNAKPAAKAALAAKEQGMGKFWEMKEKFYTDQRNLTSENFTKWAKEIGLDMKKFNADLKNNDAAYEKEINADMELGIKTAKVRGTPSLYVNGWVLNERSVQGVKNLIKDKKLTKL